MPEVNQGNRPLSPFMIGPYYRPQITSMSSIMIRITAIASLGSALLVIWWLFAAATGAEYFATVDGLLRSWFGTLVWLLAAWAIWYHVLGRLRHVIWDFGYGLELETAEKLGWAMFAGASVLAILTVIVL
ncbi:succinate dehydrogenase, cytochrome b556 subunit [Aliiroseovarius sp. PTFE2010]|uniref:succinate dehydrogenase, cytochrome b556 subunit n=1 Tax=Aliiroseovarius sp. PTFE2010 TaxID=3417190 RepID=UPI003CF492E4